MNTYENMHSRGFLMIKEHQMWGRCPTYKNHKTGEVLFTGYKDPSTMVTWEEIKAELRELWRPMKTEERTFFLNNL